MRYLLPTLILLLLPMPPPLHAADDLDVLPAELPDGPKTLMLQRYLLTQANAALDQRTKAYEKIKTEADARAYQQRMREFFVERLGGFPDRTPLEAKTTSRVERDGYVVEKVIFASRPRFHVTGLLFLPLGKGPFPGVIVPCGHSGGGKAEEKYQRACIALAKQGMVAFCYDPLGQGERHQVMLPTGKTSPPNHTVLGVSCIPIGSNFAQFRIWDGMRALDYLASRPEVDAKRLGCTGNSGGGTLTSYLMALDERIIAAAPSCYLTSMRSLLNHNGPQDAEQNIFGQVLHGMTHAEFVMMHAPKPTLMCTATRDAFRIDGAWDTFRESKRFFARFGHPERVELVETDEVHGFHLQLREGAVRWMNRWLNGKDEPTVEPAFEVLAKPDYLVTEMGQVLHLPEERTVFDVNADTEDVLAAGRAKLWADTPQAALLDRVRQLAGIRPTSALRLPKVEQIAAIPRDGYELRKLTLSPEDGIVLPALVMLPAKRNGQAVLYFGGEGKHMAMTPGGEFEQLAKGGTLVVAVDLRGLGELHDPIAIATKGMPITPDWKQWFLAYIMEKSFVGMWAEDVLATARWLRTYENGTARNRIRVIGTAHAGPAVLHAAALERELFAQVELRQTLDSWSSVVRDRQGCGAMLLSTVHGALKVYDLADLRRVIGLDRLNVVEPRDSQNEPLIGK
ncbi:MAG: acetylxylan esterase [Chthoniobacteraceae bacterium]